MKTCIYCGVEFKPYTSKQTVCSSEDCRKEYHKKRREKKQEERKKEKVCDYCGITFSTSYSIQRYCSAECRINNLPRKKDSVNSDRDLAKPRECVICNNVFSPDKRHKNAVTCSPKCNEIRQDLKAKEKQEKKKQKRYNKGFACKWCKVVFHTYSHNQSYCSSYCREESKKERYKGYREKMPVKEKKVIREKARLNGNWKKALERDKNKCVLCESTKKLHVHHINGEGEKKNGERVKHDSRLENLMTLCLSCHKNIHQVLVTFTEGEWVVQGDIFKKLNLQGSIRIKE